MGYEDSSEDAKDAEFKVGNGDLTNFSLLNVTVPQFSEIKPNSYSDRCPECQCLSGACYETGTVTKIQFISVNIITTVYVIIKKTISYDIIFSNEFILK